MIRSSLLDLPGLVHAFTDRTGGIGTPPYDTCNLALHVGDDPAVVLENHRRLAKRLGYDPALAVHMRQIHSDRIVRCDARMDFHTRPECDALITDLPGRPLIVMAADCTPVLLYDPRRRAAAAVHAGRAGAFSNIVGKTVQAMQRAFGSDPADLLAALGPAIKACCYAVGNTQADEARTLGYGFALHRLGEQAFLDIEAILRFQLRRAGVRAERTDVLPHCTACEHDRFFSYRAEGGTTGRQAGIIMLRPPQ